MVSDSSAVSSRGQMLTVYDGGPAQGGYFHNVVRLGGEIARYRWLILRLIGRSVFAPFRQSFLGIAWAIVLPVVPVTVYALLQYIQVLRVESGMPYGLYAMIGLTLWLLIAGAVTEPMSRLQADRSLLTKIRYPLIVSILSGFGKLLFDTGVRLALVGLMFAWYQVVPAWQIVLLPLLLLPHLALGLGLGIMLSLLNVVTRDTKSVVDIFVRYGVFLCGAVFHFPETGVIGTLNQPNIFYWLVFDVRAFIVFGTLPHPLAFACSAAAALLVFLLAVHVMSRTERILVSYM